MTTLGQTSADTSGVSLDRKTLKRLMRRSDRLGLQYLAVWAVFLTATGSLVHLSMGTWWVVPAMMAFGTVLTVPAYAMSHECSHATPFRTRWLNEAVFWLTSLIYIQTPTFRRYSHARHHSYTWIRSRDTQIPFELPLTLRWWLLEISDLGQYAYDFRQFFRNACGAYSDVAREVTPPAALPRIKWEARAFLAVYLGGAAAAVATGALWPVYYLVIPRLFGGVAMQLFTVIQHAEMQADEPDLRKSTRSFTTNRLGRFLYMNMNHHVEHHLYPLVPFHAQPALNAVLGEQLPTPDKGLFRTNGAVLGAVLRRTFGRSAETEAAEKTVAAAETAG